MTLNGRDDAGFLIGSEAQRDYLKALALGADGGVDKDAHETRKRLAAEAKRQRREKVWREALIVPEWWDDPDVGVTVRNRRYIARQRAIRAAFELGVDVPEWVRDRAAPTNQDRERIRGASLRRFE